MADPGVADPQQIFGLLLVGEVLLEPGRDGRLIALGCVETLGVVTEQFDAVVLGAGEAGAGAKQVVLGHHVVALFVGLFVVVLGEAEGHTCPSASEHEERVGVGRRKRVETFELPDTGLGDSPGDFPVVQRVHGRRALASAR